jgi:predicted Zn-dependent protease with MMP-like domain
MTHKEFERSLQIALRSLPKELKTRLRNIDVIIKDGPASGKTLGLYEGISLQDRIGGDYSLAMHDRITLFKRAIEKECAGKGLDVREEIRRTILHEIAHHFGITDERLEDEGIY